MTRSFYVFFDLHLNKRLSKQSWGRWFETPSRSLWRYCNEITPPQKAHGFWNHINQLSQTNAKVLISQNCPQLTSFHIFLNSITNCHLQYMYLFITMLHHILSLWVFWHTYSLLIFYAYIYCRYGINMKFGPDVCNLIILEITLRL